MLCPKIAYMLTKLAITQFGLFVKLVSQKFSQGLFFNIFWCDFLHYHFDWKMAIKLPNFSKIISSFKSKSSKKTFGFSFFLDFRHFFPPKIVQKLYQNFWIFGLSGTTPPTPTSRTFGVSAFIVTQSKTQKMAQCYRNKIRIWPLYNPLLPTYLFSISWAVAWCGVLKF